MTLLDELAAIDLGPILQARGEITVAVNADGLQAVLSAGAVNASLGELGEAMSALRGAADDPAALLRPLVDAVSGLADELGLDDLPVDDLLDAVGEGAAILAGVIGAIGGDPAALGSLVGRSLGEGFGGLTGAVGDYAEVALGELGRQRILFDTLESGLPTDGAALARLVLDGLLPLPSAALADIRSAVDSLLAAVAAIRLPAGRTGGIVVALDAVTAAAVAGDAVALRAALDDVDRAAVTVLATVRGDLQAAVTAISRLPVADVLAAVGSVSGALESATEGVLDLMERWRQLVAEARAHVEALDPAAALATFRGFVDFLEAEARAATIDRVEAQVEAVERWVRGLLAGLPLRPLRQAVTDAILGAARLVQDAGLDGPAREARALLDRVEAAVESADLAADVRAAIQQAAQQVEQALDVVIDALQAVKEAIESVADTAGDVLERAAAALGEFKLVIDDITGSVAALAVEDRGQQVVDDLRALREKAEVLVSVAPLPEPMRPLVQQLIDLLKGIDFEAAVIEPVKAAVADIDIPPEVLDPVVEGLEQIVAAAANLVPTQVVADIEAEVGAALDEIRNFDPSTLLDGLGDAIAEAAAFVDGLDPRPAAESIRAPFQAVLDGIDAAHPRRLLAPVIDAYDRAIGGITLPSAETGSRRMAESAGSTGTAAARAATAPIERLLPAGTTESRPPGATTTTPPVPDPGDLRPGDVVRLVGFVPAKLREALATLDQNAAGDVIRQIDATTAGLAVDLRRLSGMVRSIDDRIRADLDALLVPVGEARIRAALAVRAGVQAGTLEVDIDASVGGVGKVSPGRLRGELRVATTNLFDQTAQTAAGMAGDSATVLDRLASALERAKLGGLTGDLDTLLAALDPEPLALEIDAFVGEAMARTHALFTAARPEIEALEVRMRALIEELNPGALLHRFLRVLEVFRQEVNLLNPSVLADELGELHGAIRATVAAYDPAVFAEELRQVLAAVAVAIRGLDPAQLAGDLNFLAPIVARVEAALPGPVLAEVGQSIEAVGAVLADLDPSSLLTAVNELPEQVIDLFGRVLAAIKDEIVALLESLDYISGSVSVSVSASGSVG